MLTDDRTIHDILSAVEHSRIPPLETVKAICTRVLASEARLRVLEEAATPIVECYRMSGLCAENGESEEDHYHKMICRLEAALETGATAPKQP